MGIQRQTEGPECVSSATVDRGELAWCCITHRHIYIARLADMTIKSAQAHFVGVHHAAESGGLRSWGETPGRVGASGSVPTSKRRKVSWAQQVRISTCVSQDIELLDIVIDEGFSAKSLERPGIKRALAMLTSNQANAIVVVKLDRLTRSVKDLGYLCDSYFREGLPYSLLSVSDSIDTRSASGMLMLNVLMSVAQWEREAISERTQEAMDELKRRGVRMGGAPYGWQYAKEPDEHGRRNLVTHPGEQKVIHRICALHKDGLSVLDISKRLTADGVRPRAALRCIES